VPVPGTLRRLMGRPALLLQDPANQHLYPSNIRRRTGSSCGSGTRKLPSGPPRRHFGNTVRRLCSADRAPVVPPGGCDLVELAHCRLLLRGVMDDRSRRGKRPRKRVVFHFVRITYDLMRR
jgi:hypothetical protein